MATYSMCAYATPSDVVARVIFSKRHFSRDNNRAKFAAFLPWKKHPNELSVNVISGLSENAIWQIPTRMGKTAKARADLSVSDIISIDNHQESYLQVMIDQKPHKWHANIINLPSEKSRIRSIAVELVDKSKLAIKL